MAVSFGKWNKPTDAPLIDTSVGGFHERVISKMAKVEILFVACDSTGTTDQKSTISQHSPAITAVHPSPQSAGDLPLRFT